MKRFILLLLFANTAFGAQEGLWAYFGEPIERVDGSPLLPEEILGYEWQCTTDPNYQRIEHSIIIYREELEDTGLRCSFNNNVWKVATSPNTTVSCAEPGEMPAMMAHWADIRLPGGVWHCRIRTKDTEYRNSSWCPMNLDELNVEYALPGPPSDIIVTTP